MYMKFTFPRVQHKFVFDEVFDETTDNEQVYERTIKPLVLCLFERLVALVAYNKFLIKTRH